MEGALLLLAAILAAIIPRSPIAEDAVDVVEDNRTYDEDNGNLLFRQLLFWELANDGSERLVAYRVLTHDAERLLPGNAAVVFADRIVSHRAAPNLVRGPVLRRIEARFVRRTWTQHDPELLDRQFWPQELRREQLPPGERW